MRYTDDFKDYELLDLSDGQKLERWKDIILIRPDPQVVWHNDNKSPLWVKANAVYHRSEKGGGYWERLSKVPDVWNVEYDGLVFRLKPMGFKHTGLFPEQAVNWRLLNKIIGGRNLKVLNLFAYTGGATLAALNAGASVTHVDASKGMVQWAKENANASGLADKPCRWLVDDCIKFLQREIRRGNKYDGIIMDPPSYGRGPNGEIWKLENQIGELLELAGKVLSDDAEFFFLNTYTAGFSTSILDYLVKKFIAKSSPENVFSDEIGLKVTAEDFLLPCGNTTIWTKDKIK